MSSQQESAEEHYQIIRLDSLIVEAVWEARLRASIGAHHAGGNLWTTPNSGVWNTVRHATIGIIWKALSDNTHFVKHDHIGILRKTPQRDFVGTNNLNPFGKESNRFNWTASQ
eukprot:728250-Pyramimonas_sp.AAC.1